MVYINQIHPIKKGVKKNKKFLKLLYTNEEITEASKWFDTLDHSISIRRQSDPNMTLDKFLKLIDSKTNIALQLASPDPFDIRYCAKLYDKDIARFVFIECPYNDNNFNIVSKLYEESFGSKLKDEPVIKGVLEYYKERIRLGY